MVEMFDRAERLGLVSSADAFITARKLRNRLGHEYVEDRAELADNLSAARVASTLLTATLARVAEAISRPVLRPSADQTASQPQPSPLHYRYERADARHRRRAVRVAIAGGL